MLQSKFIPASFPNREQEVTLLAQILAPSLRSELPSNTFIYGKPGTGKTTIAKFVCNQLVKAAKESAAPIECIYINTALKRTADTEYRLYSYIANLLGTPVPHTGLPTDEVYSRMVEAIDKTERVLIFVLDEIDFLIERNSKVLYTLTRINSELEKSRIVFVGITNDVGALNSVDPRIKSSLSEEELFFAPYNADQLKSILSERVKEAFHSRAISDDAITLCAAYAAKEHGDARRALDLLRVAGELAERAGKQRLLREHVELALEKLDRDRVITTIKTLPQHSKVLLFSILNLKESFISTGPLYEAYSSSATSNGLSPLTLRRVSDLLNELDTLGIISARIISKGRYGRTRVISAELPTNLRDKVLNILRNEVL
ncbi:MAG: AAA family ATPase [Candidatus Altiarchaeota archaeon]|nr:AAA family ATPase [Candidatus Altiarchaeota archaeon]